MSTYGSFCVINMQKQIFESILSLTNFNKLFESKKKLTNRAKL